MSEIIKMKVAVHKSKIALATGESIDQYVRKLRDEGREHVMKKVSLADTDGGAYLVEAFSDKAVFSVYKYGAGGDSYVSTTYKRKEDKSFEFGEITEVEKVVSFKPKSGDEAIEDVSKNLGDWVKVEKNLWGGLF